MATPRSTTERYEVEGEIGRGRRAVVLAARDRVLGRRVALKRALAAADAELLLEEARRLAAVTSPHVVHLHDVLSGPPVSLVLELVEGSTLRERLRASQRLDTTTALRLAGELLQALAELHAAGVVHGDVKPENIVCRAVEPALKLLDLGSTGDATVLYLPPEADGRTAPTPAGDVYAAAVVAFELCTGRPPFDAADEAGLVACKRTQDPPTARSAGGSVPAAIEAWLALALARDPAARFADAIAALASWNEAAFAAERSFVTGLDVVLHPEIEARAAATLAAGAGLIAIVGLPGEGKSHVVTRWAAAARALGYQPILVRPLHGERRMPLAAWHRACRTAGLACPRLGKATPARAEEAHALAALRALHTRGHDGARFALAVDDLAQCDGATRRLVLRLIAAARELGLPAIATIDPGARGRSAETTARALEALAVESAILGRPAADAWRPFVGAALGTASPTDALVAHVRDRSGGNPGFARSLLDALRDRGALQRTGDAWVFRPELAGDDVPPGVAAVLEHRLADLAPRTRAILEVGAVHGGRCTPRLAARCAGIPEAEAIDRLHLLTTGRALLERDRDEYVFRMPLLGDHLRSRIAPEKLRALHAALARALAESGAGDETLGLHLYHAGERARALPHLERAGRAALERGDATAALQALDLATAAADLEVSDEAQAERRVALGLDRAEALQRLAAWTAAQQELERTVVVARAWGIDAGEMRVLAARGGIEYAQSRFDAAVETWLEAQLCAVRRNDLEAVHELALKVGNVHLETGDLAQAGAEYERVLAWATSCGNVDLEARAAHNVALVESIQGRKEQAVQHFNRSLERFRSLGRADAVARIYHNIGQIYLELGNWAEARNFFGRSMAESERTGQDALLAVACLDSAEASLRLGARDEASEAVGRAIAMSRERGDEVGVASAYRLQAALAAGAGDLAGAEARLLESIDLLSRLGQALQLGLCWKDLGALRLQTGRTGAAAAALDEARRLFATLDAAAQVAEVDALRTRCGEESPCRP